MTDVEPAYEPRSFTYRSPITGQVFVISGPPTREECAGVRLPRMDGLYGAP